MTRGEGRVACESGRKPRADKSPLTLAYPQIRLCRINSLGSSAMSPMDAKFFTLNLRAIIQWQSSAIDIVFDVTRPERGHRTDG
jgi:hypothetical protein